MLPLFDEMPVRRFPFVTVSLIVMNTLILIFTMGLLISGGDSANKFVYKYALVPWELTNGKHVSIDALESEYPEPPSPSEADSNPYGKNVYLALLTHMFLHAGIAHLLGNMWFLWLFGSNVEDVYGGMPFLVFYLICGLCAALSFWAFDQNLVGGMVGASGAISGVMGAYLVLYPRQKVFTIIFFWPAWVPAWALMLAWFAYQAIFMLLSQITMATGGTAWLAHIGGIISGFLITLLLYPLLKGRRDRLEDIYVPTYPSYMKKSS